MPFRPLQVLRQLHRDTPIFKFHYLLHRKGQQRRGRIVGQQASSSHGLRPQRDLRTCCVQVKLRGSF